MKRNQGQHLSAQEIAAIQAAFVAGETNPQISARTGINMRTLQRRRSYPEGFKNTQMLRFRRAAFEKQKATQL